LILIDLTIEGGICYARTGVGPTTKHEVDEDTKLFKLIAAHKRKEKARKEAMWHRFLGTTQSPTETS